MPVRTLYQLERNGEEICEITMEVPSWLPVTPRLPPRGLRAIIAQEMARSLGAAPSRTSFGDSSAQAGALRIVLEKEQVLMKH